ncbi:MAG: hypothetical protein MJE77_48010 [Proteobacteria bacterium]|nr:hypothetical protein [Pseudomonadota bacterium]
MARKRIGELLVQAGVLDNTGLRAGLAEQRRWGGQLGRVLVDMKLVTEEALVRALSHQLNFPTIDLDQLDVPDSTLELVSADLAEQHSLIPFNLEGKFLEVAMSDPTNLGIIDELRIRTQLNVRPYLAGPKMIERALSRCYGIGLANLALDMRTARLESEEGLPTIGLGPSDNRPPSAHSVRERNAEILALQERISQLEALVSRDEDVLRKVLGLLIEKGVATREEILERIK